jgi:hypothetical protein
MVKIANGVWSAAVRFFVVGIAVPYLVEFFSPTISKYIQLPAPSLVWGALVIIGALFAVMGFLMNAYSKGDFPWLFGKVGNGLVEAFLFTYLFLLLPNSLSSSGVSAGVDSSGLLTLVYLAVALSYAYLILDFADARRTKKERIRTGNPEAT